LKHGIQNYLLEPLFVNVKKTKIIIILHYYIIIIILLL